MAPHESVDKPMTETTATVVVKAAALTGLGGPATTLRGLVKSAVVALAGLVEPAVVLSENAAADAIPF